MMEEVVVLQEPGLLVSTTRFVLDKQTFAMSQISSVRAETYPPRRGGFVFMGILALLATLGALVGIAKENYGWLLAPVLLWPVTIMIWTGEKETHAIWLATSGGQVQALSSVDGAYIERIHAAIQDAIIRRG